MFDVRVSRQARKTLDRTEKKIRERIMRLLSTLQSEPVPAESYDVSKISASEDMYRIRVSSFRIAYEVYWKESIIRVLRIERRSETTYKKL